MLNTFKTALAVTVAFSVSLPAPMAAAQSLSDRDAKEIADFNTVVMRRFSFHFISVEISMVTIRHRAFGPRASRFRRWTTGERFTDTSRAGLFQSNVMYERRIKR